MQTLYETVHKFATKVQPLYAANGWEVINHITGNMEIPSVERIEELALVCYNYVSSSAKTEVTSTTGRVICRRSGNAYTFAIDFESYYS